jgi:hypothetical protein
MHQKHYTITKASLLYHQHYKLSLLLLLLDIARLVAFDFLLRVPITGLSNKLSFILSFSLLLDCTLPFALCLATTLFFSSTTIALEIALGYSIEKNFGYIVKEQV